MNFKFIYKICTKSEWLEAKSQSQFIGSNKDLEDGYIHFSGEDQVEATLKRFYSNQKNLILLKVVTLELNHLFWSRRRMEICFLIYILLLMYLVSLKNLK